MSSADLHRLTTQWLSCDSCAAAAMTWYHRWGPAVQADSHCFAMLVSCRTQSALSLACVSIQGSDTAEVLAASWSWLSGCDSQGRTKHPEQSSSAAARSSLQLAGGSLAQKRAEPGGVVAARLPKLWPKFVHPGPPNRLQVTPEPTAKLGTCTQAGPAVIMRSAPRPWP